MYNKRILVTGHTGFLGSHIVDHLQDFDVFIPENRYDLQNPSDTNLLFVEAKPDIVIHCAAVQGGIGFNRENPAVMFHDNMQIALNIANACVTYNVEKLVNISASCSYPDTDVLIEDRYHEGICNETVRAHGMVKRAIFELFRSYNQQYGLGTSTLCLTNLFGPRGHFNDQGKVVEMAIMKLVEAVDKKAESVEFWGTGSPLREFMYAPDAAKAVIEATEIYDDPNEILNIGTGEEWSIKDLVELIAGYVNFKGEITWDETKPDGQMRKLLDNTKMSRVLNFQPEEFTTALYNTIDWYRNVRKERN